jgi:hypothetical protein
VRFFLCVCVVVFIDKGWGVVHTSGIMPLKRFVLALFVLAASVVMGSGQVEHAPTVAQCQADQRLWLSQIEGGASMLTYDGLSNMADEMNACAEVDPDNEKRYRNDVGVHYGSGVATS